LKNAIKETRPNALRGILAKDLTLFMVGLIQCSQQPIAAHFATFWQVDLNLDRVDEDFLWKCKIDDDGRLRQDEKSFEAQKLKARTRVNDFWKIQLDIELLHVFVKIERWVLSTSSTRSAENLVVADDGGYGSLLAHMSEADYLFSLVLCCPPLHLSSVHVLTADKPIHSAPDRRPIKRFRYSDLSDENLVDGVWISTFNAAFEFISGTGGNHTPSKPLAALNDMEPHTPQRQIRTEPMGMWPSSILTVPKLILQ
jgi:hypothetical protein